MKILDQVKLMFHETTVFGEPYEKDGTTVIPASHVWGGGGGGGPAAFGDGSGAGGAGVGLDARPVGAFVIKAGEVTWVPAFDLSRIIVLSLVLAILGVLSWRSVARAAIRRSKP